MAPAGTMQQLYRDEMERIRGDELDLRPSRLWKCAIAADSHDGMRTADRDRPKQVHGLQLLEVLEPRSGNGVGGSAQLAAFKLSVWNRDVH
ncbi:hypothetical protein CSUB01_02570 [Colletotrichum sublineola]|uniref:Uncharacterized protein n=1 Tax=Colletotrichum sublineola TaxID=1173701 RepID=A0A066X4V9_COLSU|nr:hypothetical protein CSUB01_02570 [Colletotrichum sublineola]